jgi:hypothetical protein
MRSIERSQPALRLVEPSYGHPVEWSWFCGHCAAPAPAGHALAPGARVCRSCGLGLLIETPSDVVPTDRDAFLVIDPALHIQAMSRCAQTVLAVREEDAVNRPIADLLIPADAEAPGRAGFAASIAAAARGSDDPVTAIVRPWNTFGVRMRARVAPCGPPRAALAVLLRERPGPRKSY